MLIQELRERKRELGYSYETISELSGVPLGTVQKVLTGATKAPRQKMLDALKKVLLVRENAGSCLDGATAQGNGSTNACGSTVQAVNFVNTCRSAVKSFDCVYADGMQQGAVSVVKESITYGTSAPAPDEFGLTSGKCQGEYTVDDYRQIPDERRVELIDGVICDMSAPGTLHQWIATQILFRIQSYIMEKGGDCIPLVSPLDVRLDCDDKTMVQPDLVILCDRTKIKGWGVMGAPDFVLEVISKSTRKKDYTKKLQKYADAGVREYWIVDPLRKALVTYALDDEYMPHFYPLTGKVGVAIYGGDLQIDLDELAETIRDWPE